MHLFQLVFDRACQVRHSREGEVFVSCGGKKSSAVRLEGSYCQWEIPVDGCPDIPSEASQESCFCHMPSGAFCASLIPTLQELKTQARSIARVSRTAPNDV